MNHDLVCSWLELPPGEWPPDHYRLLGLPPGEDNAEVIEQRVHQRLDTVRRYQMMHPEQATEAMNRLAQAFVCLMDPSAKKTYDASLGLAPPSAPASPAAPPLPQPEALDWLYEQAPTLAPAEPVLSGAPAFSTPIGVASGPPPLPVTAVVKPPPLPPLRQPPPLPPLPPPLPQAEVAPEPEGDTAALPVVADLPPEPVDPVLEAAQTGPARRGIATKRQLYQRVARTRKLHRAWNGLGKFLSSPKRRLSRATDGPELVGLLDEVSSLLKGFPPLLGEAGQPGYLVLALTQVDTVKEFRSFSPLQREALSRDWRAGLKLLLAHKDFLRQELRAMRKRPFGRRLLRSAWGLIVDQPGAVLLLLALLAVNVALWRTYAAALWERLFP
jgi:hypothetical protein